VNRRARRLGATTAGLALAALASAALLPPAAGAHGLVGRADLPIPSWLFAYAAAIVLGASFAALAALWREPRLEHPKERRLFRIPRAVDSVCGVLGIAMFAAVVYAGFAGSDVPTANLAPTSVYVIFWVGIVVLSVLFGDVFRVFSPWRSVGALVAWAARGRRLWPVRNYPARLGRWPAAVGILCFAWMELAYPPTERTDPSQLALIAAIYAGVQLVGMAIYGVEAWSRRGDAFGVYFGMFARLSVWDRREDGVVQLRPPLSGAPRWDGTVAGSVALLCVAIGSTSFDGFSNGPAWADISPHLQSLFGDLGAGQELALELANTVGLLAFVGLVTGFYRLGIRGMKTVGRDPGDLLSRFAHTLVPIAFAYALAHYFSLLVYQSQALGYLISDPLGNGSNIFGTAGRGIDYNVISGAGIWYVQVGALVCGHVAGLILAHDRALGTYSKPAEATHSQYWMLVVMVGFTSLGLWLLSAVSR
jgi:hypothetical protein